MNRLTKIHRDNSIHSHSLSEYTTISVQFSQSVKITSQLTNARKNQTYIPFEKQSNKSDLLRYSVKDVQFCQSAKEQQILIGMCLKPKREN